MKCGPCNPGMWCPVQREKLSPREGRWQGQGHRVRKQPEPGRQQTRGRGNTSLAEKRFHSLSLFEWRLETSEASAVWSDQEAPPEPEGAQASRSRLTPDPSQPEGPDQQAAAGSPVTRGKWRGSRCHSRGCGGLPWEPLNLELHSLRPAWSFLWPRGQLGRCGKGPGTCSSLKQQPSRNCCLTGVPRTSSHISSSAQDGEAGQARAPKWPGLCLPAPPPAQRVTVP